MKSDSNLSLPLTDEAQTEIVVIFVVEENQAQTGKIVVTVVPRVMTVVATILVTEMEAGILLEAEVTRRFVLETNLQADFIAKNHLGEIAVADRQLMHARTPRTKQRVDCRIAAFMKQQSQGGKSPGKGQE